MEKWYLRIPRCHGLAVKVDVCRFNQSSSKMILYYCGGVYSGKVKTCKLADPKLFSVCAHGYKLR